MDGLVHFLRVQFTEPWQVLNPVESFRVQTPRLLCHALEIVHYLSLVLIMDLSWIITSVWLQIL